MRIKELEIITVDSNYSEEISAQIRSLGAYEYSFEDSTENANLRATVPELKQEKLKLKLRIENFSENSIEKIDDMLYSLREYSLKKFTRNDRYAERSLDCLPEKLVSLAISSDSQCIASGSSNGNIKIWMLAQELRIPI